MTPPIDLPLARVTSEVLESGEAEVRRTVTPSGVRIISQHVPAVRSIGLSMWVPVGSRDETPEVAGSTHFLEHLLFKGTQRRSAYDIAEAFDRVGGESNAETGRESTNYWARILSDNLPMAVDVLTDMVADSRIDEMDFATERGVILDELAMAQDSPTENVHDAFQLAVHGDTALGRSIGGTPEVIRKVSRDSVVSHYRRHYAPSSLIVAAAGDVEHERLVGLVEEALEASSWKDAVHQVNDPRPRRSTEALPERDHEWEVVKHREVEQAHLVIGSRGLRILDEDRPVMSVLLAVLGGSMSSRLFQEVREKRGLAYTTYAFDTAYADTGCFGMYAGTSAANVSEVEVIMRAQLEDLAANGPTEAELERVRGQIRGGVALGLEDTGSRMARLGRAEVVGRYWRIEESLAAFEAVSREDVARLAQELASRTPARALVLPMGD